MVHDMIPGVLELVLLLLCCIVWGLYLENESGIAHVTSRESNYVHKTVSTG